MEIERNAIPPVLGKKEVDLLTRLCFRQDDELKNVDGIFVFSSIIELNKLSDLLTSILQKNITKNVFITGGYTPKELAKELDINPNVTEAEALLSILQPSKFKDVEFHIERMSTNTLENVTEMLKNPTFPDCSSLLYIFKAHAAGRGYLTLRKYFKHAEILQKSFEVKYPGVDMPLTRDNWFTFDFGRERVWGEYLRIKTYGSRGDIEYKEVEALVNEIYSLTID